MSNESNASIDLAQLDKLEALARTVNALPETTQPFVSTGGQVVIHTFSMSQEQVRAVANLYDAANPATVQQLIALARRSLTSAAPADKLPFNGYENLRLPRPKGAMLPPELLPVLVHGAAAPTCPTCKGNDQNAPCAYPSEGKPGCLRDERLAAAPSASIEAAAQICDRLEAMMVQGGGELRPGERLAQAARMIRELAGAAAKTDHAPPGRALMDQWNAGAKALAELPPFPEPWIRNLDAPEGSRDHFATDQMRDYGLACIAIGRGAAVRDYISPSVRAAGAGSDQAGGLPNGWKLEEGGSDIRLVRSDGKWCGYSPDINSPAHQLTLHFLRDLLASTSVTVQDEQRNPTEAMLNAARDWSVKKYGIGIGNDAAIGCWQAMFDALAHPVQDGEKDALIPLCETCDDPAMQLPDGSYGICQACIDFGNEAEAAAQQDAKGGA